MNRKKTMVWVSADLRAGAGGDAIKKKPALQWASSSFRSSSSSSYSCSSSSSFCSRSCRAWRRLRAGGQSTTSGARFHATVPREPSRETIGCHRRRSVSMETNPFDSLPLGTNKRTSNSALS